MVLAQKFTFEYSRVEDRLKMLINYDSATERIDFFITRAMLFKLIPVIEKLLIKFAEAPVQRDYERKNLHVNSQSSSAVAHQTDRATLELLQQQLFLLEKVDFTWHAKNRSVTLLFYAKGALQCKARLNGEHFSMVMQGMMQAVPHTSWGIAPNILEI